MNNNTIIFMEEKNHKSELLNYFALLEQYHKESHNNSNKQIQTRIVSEKDRKAFDGIAALVQVVNKKKKQNQAEDRSHLISLNKFFENIDDTFFEYNRCDIDEDYNSYFNFISKSTNENFLSDNLGAILMPSKTGSFANILLNQIMSNVKDWKEEKIISVERELSLNHFDAPRDLSGMRMDIYIECENSVIILENKTLTLEHDHQTVLYYQVVKKKCKKEVFGIFLTPYGASAEQSNYLKLSYGDLINHLQKSIELSPDFKSKDFVRLFTKELTHTFIGTIITRLKKARCFRSKYGTK